VARLKSSGLSRGQLSALGTILGRKDDDGGDEVTGYAGLTGLGDTVAGTTSRPSITGVDAVDKMLYSVEDQLATFKLAMTITTVSSLAAALAGIILILDSGRRQP